MSVFRSIKGKLVNVQHDITSSIRSIGSKSGSESSDAGPVINLDAGAELLYRFQNQWEELHKNAEENAKKAQEVDEVIGKLHSRVDVENESCNALFMNISTLPQLVSQVKDLTASLGEIHSRLQGVEMTMLELQDIIEQQEIAQNKLHHQHQLHLYRQRKGVELEIAKVQLAKKHASRVQAYESQLQETLRERQKVFEADYEEQMKNYKIFGSTQLKPSSPMHAASVDLGDIEIEDDNEALNEFLQSTESQPDCQPPVHDKTSESENEDEEGQTRKISVTSTPPDSDSDSEIAKITASKDIQETKTHSESKPETSQDEVLSNNNNNSSSKCGSDSGIDTSPVGESNMEMKTDVAADT